MDIFASCISKVVALEYLLAKRRKQVQFFFLSKEAGADELKKEETCNKGSALRGLTVSPDFFNIKYVG